MKILLINTLSHLDYWQDRKRKGERKGFSGIPLGLLSLGTALCNEGYEVKIIDPMVDRDYMDKIRRNLSGTLWVGIGTMTNGVASALEISKFIRGIDKSVPICWGGVHPTLFPEEVVREDCVDYVCWGEGERFVVELSASILGQRPLREIEGVFYMDEGQVQGVRRSYFLDINKLGIPNYDLLDMEKYLYSNLQAFSSKAKAKRGKFVAVNTGVGCPYRCTFCWNTHPSQKYRIKTIENLLANIDNVVGRFDPDLIHLQDDLFFANKTRFFQFLQEYGKRGYRFQWLTNCRASYIGDDYINDEVLERIREQCVWLGMGIESGSDKLRKILDKKLSSRQIYNAAKLLGKHEMVVGYSFMTGLPDETLEDTVKSIRMMKKIKKLNPTSRFAFQCFRPYPGSALYDEAVKRGFVAPSNLAGWSILQDRSNVGKVKQDILPWVDLRELSYFEAVVRAINRTWGAGAGKSRLARMELLIWSIFFRTSFWVRTIFNYWKNLSFEFRLLEGAYGIARKAVHGLRQQDKLRGTTS